MIQFILRRLLQVIPVFLGTTLLVYFMVFALPGDPIRALFGDRPPSEAVIAQLRQQYNLDQPFWIQYGLFLKNLFTFNLGVDFTGQPIARHPGRVFPVTAMLAIEALIIQAVFGIAFGLVAGLRKGSIFDARSSCFAGRYRHPDLRARLRAAAADRCPAGLGQTHGRLERHWGSLILPAMVLGLVSFAYVLRLTRASVIENMNADYVRTATAKGLSRRQVVTTHILRNSLIPVITYLGANLGALMGGAIVTEAIFNVPGVGQKLYQAILRSEGPTVVAIVSVLVLVFVLANLLVDLLYAWLDPRIRYEN